MRQEANLKLWVIVLAYAAGIAGGARLLPKVLSIPISVDDISGLVFVLGFVVVIGAVVSFGFWALKLSNPSLVGAYCILTLVFIVAGIVAGYVRVATTAGGVTAATKTTLANNDSSTTISKTTGKTKSAGCDVEKISFIKTVRQHIEQTFKQTLSEEYRGLMMGVTLGETKEIPPDLEADFRTTGLSHILAVSGLNITILVVAFGYVIRAITVNLRSPGRYIAFTLTVTGIIFYMFLTKLQPSVVRAGIMGITALAAILASRKGNAFPALAAAALSILVVDPAALFNIGFQLSFTATIAILLFTPQLEKVFKAAHGGIAAAAALTISAQLGVAPLLIMYFGQLSLIAIVANVLVGPVIAPATVLGILISLSGAISTELAQIVAYPAQFCLAYIAAAAKYFAGWPYASMSLPTVTVYHVAAYYLLLGLAYMMLVKLNKKSELCATINDFPNRQLARTVTVTIVIAVFIIGLFGCQSAKTKPPEGFRAVFVDVGQGDATLVEAMDGATILIDGGPEPDSMLAALREYGINSIDLMIITHPHADHIGGLFSVINRYPVKQAILPAESSKQGLYGQLLRKINREGTKAMPASEGQNYKVGKYLRVKILSPDEMILGAASDDESDDENNKATVALVQYKNIRMMLTGDIEIFTEEAMIADGEARHVEILKVPHHGSKNGADADFINAIHPEVAVISAGQDNPFHHPAPTTVSLLRRTGAAVYRTDKNGSVIIESEGLNLHVSTSN